jgi:hypothetical protein
LCQDFRADQEEFAMSMSEEISRWRYLADEAKAGRLYLDRAVADGCRDACNRQIDLYVTLREDLKMMTRVTGLGKFDCSDELAKMMGNKAIGGEAP